MAALQEALIASEEKRLSVSRALLDFKMEHNESLESHERVQYDLTEKILELEARLAQSIVNKVRCACMVCMRGVRAWCACVVCMRGVCARP